VFVARSATPGASLTEFTKISGHFTRKIDKQVEFPVFVSAGQFHPVKYVNELFVDYIATGRKRWRKIVIREGNAIQARL
jgi:hypothetical protein